MANLTASAVTLKRDWVEGDRVMRKQQIVKVCTAVLTGQGGLTNLIPASLFNMRQITDVSSFTKNDNSVIISAAPKFDGSAVLLSGSGNQTPTDATGTFAFVVRGLPITN